MVKKGKKKSRQQKKADSKTKERDRLVKLTFVKYGSKSVLQEYHAMSLEIAKVLMEALYGMITQLRVTLMLDKAQLPQVQSRWSHSAPLDINCPLYLLLHHGCDPNVNIDMRIYQAIKDRIKTWGAQNDRLYNPFFFTMREIEVEKNFQDLIAGTHDEMHVMNHSNTLATKTSGSTTFDWKSLTPITIEDLKLFDSCKGSVLRGSIVGLPFVSTGITTFLQDEGGSIIQLGIYNYIPGKMTRRRAAEYARKHLPKGIRVEIAEPFTKIFVDGNRGVRIDDCREFRVEGERSKSLSAARLEGNEFFQQKLFLAASEAYMTGLGSETFVPTVLSNRAQAFICLEDWGSALADAASSLTIRPSCEKTRLRYRKALEKLEQEHQSNESTRSFPLQEALLKTDFPVLPSKTNPEGAEKLKAKGNAAFVRKDYEKAIQLYTRCLFESGGDARVVLSNWSQASIELESYHEAVAASAASLRIWLDDKAIFRLCKSLAHLNEYCLAGDLLKHHRGGSNASLKGLETEIANLKTRKFLFPAEDYIRGTRKPDICPDYASDRIETFLDSRKGRGIRATDDLSFGQMILLQSPLMSAGSDMEKDKSWTFSFDKNQTVNDTSQTLLHSEVLHRLNRDELLARRMSLLSDGSKKHPPLVPLSDLLNSISVQEAPLLLPPHNVHYESKVQSLSPEQVRGIISTNAFGSFGDAKQAFTGSTETKNATMVYSAISMFNHSTNPNCVIIDYSGSSRMVLTRRAVKRGEELTISYHSDPTAVKNKWGIEN